MNQTVPATSAPGSSLLPDWIGAYTTAHFIWIGVLALLTVLAIFWGMRLAARRRAAEREIIEHNAEITAPPPASTLQPVAVEPRAFPPAPVPVTPPPPPPVAAAPVNALDSGPATGPVTQLKGLGPKVATRLAELGITTVGQFAALSDDQAADLDAQLGTFRGRLERDRWIEQARFLAAGDRAGFEAVFGRL